MGFADALAHTARQAKLGRVDQILADLDPTEADQVRTALEDSTISAERICVALKSIGQNVGRASIERWRRDHGVR